VPAESTVTGRLRVSRRTNAAASGLRKRFPAQRKRREKRSLIVWASGDDQPKQ
jgi:hypothetical protein